MKISTKTGGILMAIGAALIAIIGVSTFLFTRDGDGPTGLEVLKQEGGGFWLGVGISSIVISAVVYFFVKAYRRNRGLMPIGQIRIAFWTIAIFLGIAFGKGCTDKANDAVTTKKGRVEKVPVDSTRIPAEELLPRK